MLNDSFTSSWSLDDERMWLASVLSEMTTIPDKQRFVRSYLTSLTRRHISFTGDGPMPAGEYDDMVSFCLNTLYDLERAAEWRPKYIQ